MPKNAVQRLQKIENDLKTVISIYDITNKPKKEHDKPETPQNTAHLSQIGAPKHLESTELHDKYQKSSQPKSPLLFPWKKNGGINPKPFQGVHSGESGLMQKKWKPKKPGSAPTSTSMLSTICESDYVRQPSTESMNKHLEMSVLSKTETSDNLKTFNRLDSNSNSVHEVLMTPSKTLQTAYEILAKNNYKENEDLEEEGEFFKSMFSCKAKEVEDYESPEKSEGHPTLNVKTTHSIKRNSSLNLKKTQRQPENQNDETERSRSVSPRQQSSQTKSLSAAKFSGESKKNKSFTEISSKHSTIPRKIQRLEGSMSDSSDGKTCLRVAKKGSLQGKRSKLGACRNEKEDQSTTRDNDDATSNNKYSKEVKTKSGEKNNAKAKQEKSNSSNPDEKKNQNIFDKERNAKLLEPTAGSDNQQTTAKNPEQKNQEAWVKEFSKIIEISNEKLEKMKVSKELALEIAKHLKDKYDEIQQSKGELMQKIKETEKDNEKLTNEIKDINESKMKLQLKIDGLKRDSNTKLMEKDVKAKDIIAENNCLKTKICELQKKCHEELLNKQKEIDKIQKERLAEIRSEIKSREIRDYSVQRLNKEKCELQRLLNGRNSKIEAQEEKIHQLQEEVQKQKLNVTKKTERLEETNKELESIRQNSTDLEDQVKTLRKRIENFDEIQQNLMKQTMAYHQQIKANQEEIAKLNEENSKLQIELENGKDALLIKTKIIEDQQETIKQLRDKSEEIKVLMKRNQSLERVLNIEREEKLELQEAVEHLKWRKDELKNKIKVLENDLLLAPQEVVRDLQKTQIVLHELENQVQIKQKEWELQLQTLLREKEQACSAAEFATKKLMQTTNEFQKQSQAQKRLHRLLTENLAEKEKNLREANEKKNYTQSKQNLSHGRLDDKISWLKDRHSSSIDDDAIMDWYFRNSSCHESIKNKRPFFLSS